VTGLVVVQQYPSDGGKPDDNGNGDRPNADADVANGLTLVLIVGNFSITLFILFVHVVHRLPSHERRPTLSGLAVLNLTYPPGVVDGCRFVLNEVG
jgi:hypothetical protein